MRKLLSTSKGFTLVELMVVITIIAILSIIGITVFTSAQGNARDTRRRLEINAIANALETNKPPGGTYQPLTGAQFVAGVVPSETTTPLTPYSIAVNSANAVPAMPTGWTISTTVSFPTVENGKAAFAEIKANAASPPAFPPAAGTTQWVVCALLENGGSSPGNIYCKQSSQ